MISRTFFGKSFKQGTNLFKTDGFVWLQVGCKRITPSDHFIRAFNRDNVTLVTDPIETFTADGIRTQDGTEHKVDTIVYATGFAMVDHYKAFPAKVPIRNQNNIGKEIGDISNGIPKQPPENYYKTLDDQWGDVPNTYLGVTCPGFPNSFFLSGPGTGIAAGSLMLVLECQFSYITQCIRYMIEKNVRSMAVKKEVNDQFQNWKEETIKNKAFAHSSCTSWYRNKRGVSWFLWPAQPFFYWWYTLKLDPSDFNRK